MTNWDEVGQMPMEIRVRWEIWESFVSLLRSYAAAAGTDYSVSNLSDWAKVEHKDRAVRFCFSPSTGEAIWRKVQPEIETWGGFHIKPDGTFDFPGGPEQLDMAVIDWISWLRSPEVFPSSGLDTLQSAVDPNPTP